MICDTFITLQEKVTALLKNTKELKEDNTDCHERIAELQMQLLQVSSDAKLSIEKAVITKEREMQSMIREIDRENAVLKAKIDQLTTKTQEDKNVESERDTNS